jgi:hypothetical protein
MVSEFSDCSGALLCLIVNLYLAGSACVTRRFCVSESTGDIPYIKPVTVVVSRTNRSFLTARLPIDQWADLNDKVTYEETSDASSNSNHPSLLAGSRGWLTGPGR